MSIELVMPSNHLVFCRPLLLLPSIFPSIRVFANELARCIRWPEYWSFSLSISPSNEFSGLIMLDSILLLFSSLWLFSFVSAFLTSLIKLILWLKFSIDRRQVEDMVGQGPESCSVSIPMGCLTQTSFFFFLIFIFSGFCHTLKWNSHGFTCVPHPDPPSHLPLHPLPLGFPSAPGPSACLLHPTWAGDLFHPR